ncbi:MAG TPA: sugar ABC transporter ATP-binding protein [Geminicoccaceae bacterium]|nr:sugar ABC transporter ATP-binding protein [Geminicoccaceae bacterium]
MASVTAGASPGRTAPAASGYLLEAESITKRYPGVVALDGVQIRVRPGSVHAVMGENGAGKSTLMKILAGNIQPNEGEIRVKGQPRHFHNPRDATNAGVAMIHQELLLVPDMTIAENMWVGREPLGRLGIVDHGELSRRTRALLEQLGIALDPERRLDSLTVANQQMVETAKAVSYDSEILIMDEPTSAITDKEVDHLFRIIRQLRGEAKIGEEILSVRDLALEGVFKDVTFSLRKGEILGLAGLVGAGRTNVAETIFGVTPATGGEIRIDGRPVVVDSPKTAMEHGLTLLTEDRKLSGCFLMHSVLENMQISSIRTHTLPGGFVKQGALNALCGKMKDALRVKTPTLDETIGNLSGGNQQKALLARCLMLDPRVLILDEPTRGIDVGAKSEIHKLISDLAAKGVAILMISSEMPEILGMSDRIIVMHEGHVSGLLQRDEATQEKIMALAAK